MKRNAATFSEASIPAAPNLSHEKQKPIVSSCDISTISAACGGGLASNEVSLNIPVNDLDIASYASVLDFLLSCYGIQMVKILYNIEFTFLYLMLHGLFIAVHYVQTEFL